MPQWRAWPESARKGSFRSIRCGLPAPSLYDPLQAVNLGRIQGSRIQLSAAETALLAKNGFVLSQRQRFYSFSGAYAQLYLEHLLVYISADSILHALHRSYDDMLAEIESSYLQAEIGGWLDGLRRQLAGPTAADYPSAPRPRSMSSGHGAQPAAWLHALAAHRRCCRGQRDCRLGKVGGSRRWTARCQPVWRAADHRLLAVPTARITRARRRSRATSAA